MRFLRFFVGLAVLPFCSTVASAATLPEGTMRAVPHPLSGPPLQPAYKALRDEENWKSSCAADATKADRLADLKCISLGSPNRYLTIGGDVRLRYEHYVNKQWDPRQSNVAYILRRERLDFDIHSDRLRAFAEFENASAPGAPFDPIARNDFAATAAYAQYDIGGSTDAVVRPLAVKVGRQQFIYGANRMLDNRSSPNTIQAFDGVRLRYTNKVWQSDLFYTRPVTVGPYAFDDAPNARNSLLASYTTYRGKRLTFDAYGIVDQRGSETTARGTAPSIRDTLGVRVARAGPHVDYDVEFAKQFGSFGAAHIDAFMLGANSGYGWKRGPHAYRVGLAGHISSGDRDPSSAVDTQFRPPYEIGLLFGAVQANGTPNTSGFGPSFAYTYREKTTIALRSYFYYRTSRADGIYGPNGALLRAPAGSRSANVGNVEYLTASRLIGNHLTANIGYARYNIGGFLRDSGPVAGTPSAPLSLFTTLLHYQF